MRSSATAGLAKELRRLRDRAGLSLARLAKHCWCSKSSLERYLNGKIFPPREIVAAISDACGGDTPAVLALWERAWAARDAEERARPAGPRQIPADVRGFTGRAAELSQLDDLLSELDTGEGAGAVVLTAIAGTAGVGKTALAVHWGRRVADRFPDGQLWVNLRGYDPAQPMTPEQALTGFLRALGVPGADIPLGLDEQTGLYRSLLTDKRLLVVLDNAGSAEQVRPLLPGAPGCLVVVTSRDDLAGLVARDGATRLRLDRLTPHDSVALLRKLLRPAHAEPDDAVVERLSALCARLPLALRIAADRVCSQAVRGLVELVSELAVESRLDALTAGDDPYTAVRAVFSWSYQALEPRAAALFRMLGLVVGVDWDEHAAAALAGRAPVEARRLLGVLCAAHLIERRRDERFQMHDLLRAYAIERVETEEPEPVRRAALTRLLDHYLAAAASVMDIAFPHERHRRPRVDTGKAAPVPVMGTAAEALAWLDRECGNMIGATSYAALHGWPAHVMALAATLHGYLYVVYRLTDALVMHRHALDAVRALDDRAAEVGVLNNLAIIYMSLDREAEAMGHARQALTMSRDLADRAGEANAFLGIGKVHWTCGRYVDALDAHQQALAGFRESADKAGELAALNNLGDTYLMRSAYAEAAAHYRQAIALCPVIGDRRGEATALANLGLVFERWGRYEEAFHNFQRALAISREIGQRLREAHTLDDLARIYLHRRDIGTAIEHAQQALAIFTELGNLSGLISAHEDLARIYLMSGRYDAAAEHARHAIAVGRRAGQPYMITSLNGLGEVELAAGRPADSLRKHEHALALAREVGSAHEEARALDGIAHARHALGDDAGAVAHWELALARYVELGLPEADDVTVKLDELRSSAICEGPSAG